MITKTKINFPLITKTKINFIVILFFALFVQIVFAQSVSGPDQLPINANTQPEFKFVDLDLGQEAKGTIGLKGSVEMATAVEFYLKMDQFLSSPIYLGKGVKDGNFWKFSWDTTKNPNGRYALAVKIFNSFGDYLGKEVSINIKNAEAEKVQTLEAAKPSDQKLDQAKKGAQQEMISNVENSTNKAKEAVVSSQLRKTELEVGKSLSEAKEYTATAIEKFTTEVKNEQQVKENIVKQEETKKNIETKIGNIQNDIKAIESIQKPTDEAKFLEAVKKDNIQKYKEEKSKIEDRISSAQVALKEIQQRKAEVKEEIIKKNTSPVAAIEKAVSEEDKFKISQVKGEIEKKTEEGLAKLESEVLRQTSGGQAKPAAEVLTVERVEVTALPNGGLGLKIQGKGKPDSFITVYIYSNLIVMNTKTDTNGNWTIVLDKPLPDGTHEVYTALNNNLGETTTRSESFVFAKTGNKVAAITISSLSTNNGNSLADVFQKNSYFLVVLIIILALIVSFIVIGISSKNKEV